MLIATIAACGLWVVSWMSGKRLASGWGVLLPCALVPLMNLSFPAWRVMMVMALLATIGMLYHKRLRHYLLLPSCLALASGMAAMTLNFGWQ